MTSDDLASIPAQYNIGIITGSVSGVIAVDLDLKYGGLESLAKLEAEHGVLPRTMTTSTGGGGAHHFFHYDSSMAIKNLVGVAPGIDIRSDGGFVVAPPSLHQSGQRYTWIEGCSPFEMEPAIAPDWLISLMQKQDKPKPKKAKLLPDSITEGTRNASFASMAGSLRRKGFSEPAILAAMQVENGRCTVPLEDDELARIASSISRYEPEPAKLEWNEETRKVLDGLIGAIQDFETVFEPHMLELLALANQYDPARFAVIKRKLKGKVNLRDLEKAIKHRLWTGQELTNAESMPSALQNFGKMMFRVPSGWLVDLNEGVKTMGSGFIGGSQTICFTPIAITRRFRNIDSGTEKVELIFFRDHRWNIVVAARSMLFNKNSILRLADSGLPLSSNNSEEVIEYLTKFENVNQDLITVVHSVAKLGWLKDGGFFPFCNPKQFEFEQDSKEAKEILNGLEPSGSLDMWLKTANDVRKNPVARFTIAASFASVLVEPLRKRVFFIHVWHNSRSGKSATMKLAISVWGNPQKLIGSFNSTTVGLERMAAALRNLPFAIDELQVLNTKRMSSENVIYMLAQGQGRTRGNKDGGIQELASWRNIILTNGEEALTGSSTQDGAHSRTFEIYAQPVDDLDLASRMHGVSEQNYGYAGRIFINRLCQELEGHPDMLQQLYDHIKPKLAERYPENIHINEVAIVCLGDYLSSIYVFGENQETAMKGSIDTTLEMLEQNHRNTQSDNIERAWDMVRGWIIGHSSRFTSLSAPPMYGKSDVNGEYLVIPAFIHRALEEAGFSPKKVFRGFAERGYIQGCVDANGINRLQQLKRIDGKPCRVYVINLPSEGQSEDEDFLN